MQLYFGVKSHIRHPVDNSVLHVGVVHVLQGHEALLHGLRGGPLEHVVRPASLVVGAWTRKESATTSLVLFNSVVPDNFAPPNGCWPTTDPVDLSFT